MSANQKYIYIQMKEASSTRWYYDDVNAGCFFCISEPRPEQLLLCKVTVGIVEMSFCRYVSKWVGWTLFCCFYFFSHLSYLSCIETFNKFLPV